MNKEVKKQIIHHVTNCRSKKLRSKMIQLLKLSRLFPRDLRVQQSLDEFYYMQKQQEMETLEDKLKDSISQTMMYLNLMEATYTDAAARWKKDFVKVKRITSNMIEIEQENLK